MFKSSNKNNHFEPLELFAPLNLFKLFELLLHSVKEQS